TNRRRPLATSALQPPRHVNRDRSNRHLAHPGHFRGETIVNRNRSAFREHFSNRHANHILPQRAVEPHRRQKFREGFASRRTIILRKHRSPPSSRQHA